MKNYVEDIKAINNSIIETFPIEIAQENEIFCLPASLQALINYHSGGVISQMDLFNQMNRSPSFGTASSLRIKGFHFEVKYPETFEEWKSIIQMEVILKKPVTISTRVNPNAVHIRVAIGVTNKSFLLYNPGANLENGRIISSKEEYFFQDAENNWNLPNKCGDLLLCTYIS